MTTPTPPGAASFGDRPHRTLLGLAVPVFFSLVAEPITGLVDTAFVARLGAPALAALGVGTVVLSSLFWIFNFLGIGTQTEVATFLGADRSEAVGRAWTVSVLVAAGIGTLLATVGQLGVDTAIVAMGADAEIAPLAADYLAIRLVGAPAVLVTVAAFGALRGAHDMRIPLWVAVGTNALNIVLDAILIFGWGPIPAFGIAGAAWASTVSQWLGGAAALVAVRSRLGRPARPDLETALGLFVVGRDLFIRTGALVLFIALTTRVATLGGSVPGAAHQAVRQVWTLTALMLDGLAVAAQSLVGTFIGAGRILDARRVASVGTFWSVVAGVVIGGSMLGLESAARELLVPTGAAAAFSGAWLVAALTQPLNAVSFLTDGVHWGTRDYRYLRNAVLLATVVGATALAFVPPSHPHLLDIVWWITGLWIAIRAGLGLARIWPGLGAAPLAPTR